MASSLGDRMTRDLVHEPPASAVRDAVARALAEDLLPLGDLTASLIPPATVATGQFVTGGAGVVAGTACASETYQQLDSRLRVEWQVCDGQAVEPGGVLGRIHGPLATIVTGERTALNFLRHLSGVASLTARFVAAARAASDGHTRVLDTRKTTPGLRALEKAAVRAGGGGNHRANLSDAVMLKDNHLAGMPIVEAVRRAKQLWPGRPVFVECDEPDQIETVIGSGADRVMLDNFTPALVADAVSLVAGRIEVEVTGGVALETIAAYAAARPDFVSVGALTHSAGVLDIGLDVHVEGS
jgi:nicotinate-nucleotide pyrophosphorylase (carboxylating)